MDMEDGFVIVVAPKMNGHLCICMIIIVYMYISRSMSRYVAIIFNSKRLKTAPLLISDE